MRPNYETNKNISELARVSNRIIDIFNHVEKLELDDISPKEIGLKPILELRDLLIQEKKLYDTLSQDDEFGNFIKDTVEKRTKFQMKFNVSNNSLKRIITSLVGYFKNDNKEFDFNIIGQYPEFMNLNLNSKNQNASLIYDALNEEIYREYLVKLESKIKDPSYVSIRELLISKKYNVLRSYSNTNIVFIDAFRPRKRESRLYKILRETGTTSRDFNYIKYEYIFDFFKLFFLGNLRITDTEIYDKKTWADIVDKLTIAEIMTEIIDYSNLDTIEGLFYKQVFEINIRSGVIENKVISKLVVSLFEQKSQINRKLKNKSMF